MSEKKTNLRNAYTDNLGAVLICLIVTGNFIDVAIEGSQMARSLFLFIYSFHMPFLIFLTGAMWGETAQDREKTLRRTGYLIFLYFLMKLIVSITRLALGSAFSFSLVKDTRTPWYFWVIAVYGVLVYYLREVDRTAVLVCSLLLALICGYNESIGDFLSVSRLIVFFPFFCMGQMCGIGRIENLGRKWQTKLISLCVLVAALILVLGFTDKLYFWRPLLTGRSSYKQLKDLYRWGPLFRMVSYVSGMIISMALLVLTPRRKLGYISVIGERFPQIYFWYRPVLYILTGVGIDKLLEDELGWQGDHIAWLVCGLLCVALLSLKILGVLTNPEFMVQVEKKIEGLKNGRAHCYQIKKSEKSRTIEYICAYTVVFTVTFLIVYSAFIFKGKSFIMVGGGGDGRTQQFPALVYIGQYIRRTVLSLLFGKGIPVYDVNLALGSDIIGPLYNHAVFSPLQLISAFVPTRFTEYLFNILCFMRLYFAGLAFSGMCFHFHKKEFYVLIGAIIFVFSGCGIECSVRSDFLMYPMIQLPLMIWGADLILQKRRPIIFVLSVFSAALCGFYLLYMMTIMVVVYVLVKGCLFYRKKTWNEMFQCYVHGVAAYVLGIGLAAVIVVPAVLLFFESGRFGFTNAEELLHYELTWYLDRFSKLIAPVGSWDNLTVAAVVLPAVVVLFSRKEKEYRPSKWLLVIAAFTYLIPFGGYVMNGFQYPSTRWTFGFVLILAFVVVEILPHLMSLTRRSLLVCLVAIVIYGGMVLSLSRLRTEQNMYGVVILLTTFLGLIFCTNNFKEKRTKRFGSMLLLVMVIINVGLNGIYKFSLNEGKEISNYPNIGARTSVLEDAIELKIKPYLSENPGRVDSTSAGTNHNMVWQVPMINGYWSVMNANTMEFFDRMQSNNRTLPFRLKGTDQRTIFTTLLSNSHFIDSALKSSYLPYGYSYIADSDGYAVYENRYALPWGYTYDKVISYETLERMNGVEMQETMLQALALDDQEYINSEKINLDEYEIPYNMKCNGCSWENGVLTVSQNGAKITLNFEAPAGIEEYIYLSGFNINGTGIATMGVTMEDDKVSKGITVFSTLYNWYYGCEDYLVNLGYSEEERIGCSITFPQKGTFKLDDIQLIALPMENYPERVESLRAEPMENIRWDTNRFTGTVDLSKDKILCVSIPYSKDWSAIVDGKKVDILRGNYFFMCLPLTSGHHDIEFRYHSPGIVFGLCITLISIGILIRMIVLKREKECESA